MAVKGLDRSIQYLRQYSKEVQKGIQEAVEDTTLEIERQAKLNARLPGQQLPLSSSNIGHKSQNTQKNNTDIGQFIFSSITPNGFTGQIGIAKQASLMAIYLEFGTGASAAGYVPTLPKEFQEIARKYYINGKGTLIKQPFLLPAYFEHAPKLTKKIREVLRSGIK